MKTQSKIHRTLLAFLITGLSIFSLVPALAADAPNVTGDDHPSGNRRTPSVFDDCQSGPFDLVFLRTQDRRADRREGRYKVCVLLLRTFMDPNDGKTLYTLTVSDVPVYGFWSVTLYDDKGLMPVNKYNSYSFNNVTARKDEEGSITIHFGGDPKADNFLPIVPGWNYIVRMYKLGPEILTGTWTFQSAQPVQ